MAVGSGGSLALAAARALLDQPLTASEIGKKAMAVAASIDIYTNGNFVIEELETEDVPLEEAPKPTTVKVQES
jgi:ATP-dependent HslUV protease subunit HslV